MCHGSICDLHAQRVIHHSLRPIYIERQYVVGSRRIQLAGVPLEYHPLIRTGEPAAHVGVGILEPNPCPTIGLPLSDTVKSDSVSASPTDKSTYCPGACCPGACGEVNLPIGNAGGGAVSNVNGADVFVAVGRVIGRVVDAGKESGIKEMPLVVIPLSPILGCGY